MKMNDENTPEYYVPSKLGALIPIHSDPKTLRFAPGKYHIYVSEGWLVNPGSFRVRLSHKESTNAIDIYRTNWPVQNLKNWKRLKRVWDFKIETYGEYTLEFINPDDVVVKRSSLFLFNMFFPNVDPKKVNILIEKA